MAVTISNIADIKDTDLAYGSNIVTLTNSTSSPNRMVLQIVNTANEVMADLRQLPNTAGFTHFDIQTILQGQVAKSPDQGDASGIGIKLFTLPDECFDYYFQAGSVSTGGVVSIDNTYSGSIVDYYLTIPGRKPFAYSNGKTQWQDYNAYIPSLSETPSSPTDDVIVETYAKALTDRDYDSTAYSAITDGKPDETIVTNPAEEIFNIAIGSEPNTPGGQNQGDDYSLSWLNRWRDGVVSAAPAYINGINYFVLQKWNGNTLVATTRTPNIVSNGGGPNNLFNDSATPLGEYSIIGTKVGFNQAGVTLTNATHYYAWVEVQAGNDFVALEGKRCSRIYRINIDDNECNDFLDNVQVRWLNSVGGTDFFSFRKRNDEAIRMTRNTYTQTNQDWAAAVWTQYPYERGSTIYNQVAEENWTANTRYLSDSESNYLKNLYMSPSVQVKIGYGVEASWVPVVLTSNTWNEKTFRKDKLFQHTITFKMANNLNAQGG